MEVSVFFFCWLYASPCTHIKTPEITLKTMRVERIFKITHYYDYITKYFRSIL